MSLRLSDELNLNALAAGKIKPKVYSDSHRKKKPVLRERAEQAEVVSWADQTTINGYLIGEYLAHIPNEGQRGPQARKDFIELGGRKGYPDMTLDIPNRYYHGLRIEMKAPEPYDAAVTKEQRHWHIKLREMGYRVEVCKGAEAAKRLIIEYMQDA